MALVDFTNPGESIQRKGRNWTKEFRDQHGRRFSATYDKGNQRPIGELKPEGFNPPWLPLGRFIVWEAEGSFVFRWDYLAMANELASETAAKYEEYATFAIENKSLVSIPEIGGPVDPLIRRVCGKPPLSPAIPMACAEGDPWILGEPGAATNPILQSILNQSFSASSTEALRMIRASLANYITADAAALVPTIPAVVAAPETPRTIHDPGPLVVASEITYQQFVSECAGRKMRMPDIVAAWKEHKANLAAELVGA